MRPDTFSPPSVRPVWRLIWRAQNQRACLCVCECVCLWRKREKGGRRLIWGFARLLCVQWATQLAADWLDPALSFCPPPKPEPSGFSLMTPHFHLKCPLPASWLESPQLWFTSKYWPSGFLWFPTIRWLMSACQSDARRRRCARARVDSRANGSAR